MYIYIERAVKWDALKDGVPEGDDAEHNAEHKAAAGSWHTRTINVSESSPVNRQIFNRP